MPTNLPRTQITHTPTVQRALEAAARQWPDQKPGALLVHLIKEGSRALEDAAHVAEQDRRSRVLAVAGSYSGVYGPDYFDEVQAGWKE